MKVYIVHYEDRWEPDHVEFVGVYSSRKLANKKINDRIENIFVKHVVDKDKYRDEYKKLHEVEEVEVDQ